MMSAPSLARCLAAALAAGVVTTMLTSVAAEAAPEGVVMGAGVAGTVPGRYIVTMNDAASAVPARGLPGTSDTEAYASIGAFSATMTAKRARQLAADPVVASVEQDRRIDIESTQSNPDWGLDRIDQRSRKLSRTFTPTDNGELVHAYVIDTGIRITHKQFGGRASYGYDFVGNDKIASDCNGHGTHVAGTIGGSTYGVAKKVKLVAVRVLSCSGSGYVSGIIRGIEWVTQHAIRPAVANMSLGGAPDGALNRAVAASIKSGVTYTVAAGNADVNAEYNSPANLAAAITVGATDRDDARAYFSNYGSLVDLFAPGEDIRSAWDTSNTATAVDSGTSMAAPHVAGAAALALDLHRNWSPATVRTFLVAEATKNVLTSVAGSPNRLLYTPR